MISFQWIQLGDSKCHDKVGHAIRDAVKKSMKQPSEDVGGKPRRVTKNRRKTFSNTVSKSTSMLESPKNQHSSIFSNDLDETVTVNRKQQAFSYSIPNPDQQAVIEIPNSTPKAVENTMAQQYSSSSLTEPQHYFSIFPSSPALPSTSPNDRLHVSTTTPEEWWSNPNSNDVAMMNCRIQSDKLDNSDEDNLEALKCYIRPTFEEHGSTIASNLTEVNNVVIPSRDSFLNFIDETLGPITSPFRLENFKPDENVDEEKDETDNDFGWF